MMPAEHNPTVIDLPDEIPEGQLRLVSAALARVLVRQILTELGVLPANDEVPPG